jgi:hypothetical protein
MTTTFETPRTGSRLSCEECGTVALVTKDGAHPIECGNHIGSEKNAVGKRKSCAQCDAEVLIAKAGSGTLSCHGQPMVEIDGRRLPTSD